MQADKDWRAKLTPEKRVLLYCARTHLGELTLARLRNSLTGDLRWVDIAADATQHHVEPLLYHALRQAGDGLVPGAWMDAARQRAKDSAAFSLVYVSELLRVASLFEAENIPLIPYKGPVLAALAYGDLALRRFVDLDFFTEQRHIPRAAALLKSAGFRANFGPQEERTGPRGYAPGQYAFTRERSRLQIEVHTERTLRYFPRPLDFNEMKGRLIEVRLADRVLNTFSVEDTLVMVCVHGAKHFWERLSWVADVAELVKARPVNWPFALQVAERLQCTRTLLLGLMLANELLDAPVGGEVLAKARADGNVARSARELRGNLLRGRAQYSGVWRRAQFRYGLRQNIWQGIRHMARLSLVPTESDRAKLRLPPALAPLYFVVRPLRLIQVYGTGLFRRAGSPAREELSGGASADATRVSSQSRIAKVESQK